MDFLNCVMLHPPMPDDCSQCVAVHTENSRAAIRLYERRHGRWRERRRFRTRGICGRGGAVVDKREGDGCTPCGCFAIGEAFYIGRPPYTGLSAFAVTPDTYWVDDPSSPLYNRCVISALPPCVHAEHMQDYEEYTCGFVIDHNPCCCRDRGSAVFFHAALPSSAATAGCIATTEEMVRRYLRRLDAARHPYILIE